MIGCFWSTAFPDNSVCKLRKLQKLVGSLPLFVAASLRRTPGGRRPLLLGRCWLWGRYRGGWGILSKQWFLQRKSWTNLIKTGHWVNVVLFCTSMQSHCSLQVESQLMCDIAHVPCSILLVLKLSCTVPQWPQLDCHSQHSGTCAAGAKWCTWGNQCYKYVI